MPTQNDISRFFMRKTMSSIRRMRCIIIQPYVAPYRYDFFRMLAEKIELKVLYMWPTPGVDEQFEQLEDNLAPALVERVTGGVTFKKYYAVRPKMKKIIDDFKPDWVITHEYNTVSLMVWLFHNITHAKWKWAIWSSDNSMMAETCSGVRRTARDFFARRCDELMLYSNSVKMVYERIVPCAKGKIMVCPNLQSTARIRTDAQAALMNIPYPDELAVCRNERIFLYVGRLAEEKNLPAMIDAFAHASVGNSWLVIVGAGPENEMLRQLVKEKNPHINVVFAGKKTGRELLRFYLAADVLMLVSKHETFGAVVNEALALGIPVILSRNTGARELINQKNGWLVNPESIEDITEKIQSAYAQINNQDKTHLRKPLIADRLPEYVDDFIRTLQKRVGEYE